MTRVARGAASCLLALWSWTIWTLSSQRDPEDYVGVHFRLNDKVAHGIAFAAGGFLAAWAASSNVRRLQGLVAAIVFCGLWGVLDEIHQSFVPGRDSSALDLAADLVGTTIGAVVFVRLVAGRSRRAAQTMNPVA